MISGILLAAGESKRMEGAFKPLLRWGKRTVIGECAAQLRNSKLGDIYVVLGHREQEIRSSLAGAAVQFVINDDYKKGMLSSIKTGIGGLHPNSTAFMLALVDQPMITSELIDRLIEAYGEGDYGIVAPSYQGRLGHPVIIAKKYFDDILQLDDDHEGGLRSFIASHRDDLLEVPVETSAVIEDIDNPGDYERLSKQVEPIYAYHKWQP